MLRFPFLENENAIFCLTVMLDPSAALVKLSLSDSVVMIRIAAVLEFNSLPAFMILGIFSDCSHFWPPSCSILCDILILTLLIAS